MVRDAPQRLWKPVLRAGHAAGFNLFFPSGDPGFSDPLWRADRQPPVRGPRDAPPLTDARDAPEIDGNLYIDDGFEGLSPGDILTVTVEDADDYDLWAKK